MAVPNSWVSINLAKETLAAAASKIDVPGFSAATAEHYMQSLQKDHAVFAFDIASETSSPAHYVRNLYAFCAPSGVTDTGASSVAFLTQEAKAQLSTIASQVTAHDVTIGGVPGIEISYKLNSGTGVDVQGTQLVVLPKPDVACYVTLSFSSPQTPGNYLAVAAATAQFP